MQDVAGCECDSEEDVQPRAMFRHWEGSLSYSPTDKVIRARQHQAHVKVKFPDETEREYNDAHETDSEVDGGDDDDVDDGDNGDVDGT